MIIFIFKQTPIPRGMNDKYTTHSDWFEELYRCRYRRHKYTYRLIWITGCTGLCTHSQVPYLSEL